MQLFARRAYCLDVRPLIEHLRIEQPHASEGRIEEAQAPIAAEHRHCFGEIVEGFTLHADQRIIAAHEFEAFGHVVEGRRHMFVSPGLGTSILPVRFGVPPEVTVLELHPG